MTLPSHEREENEEFAPHQSYTPKGVDAQVVHKQALSRLTDVRSKGERTVVHAHAYVPAGAASRCTHDCKIYHECKTDGKPRGHSIAEKCPDVNDRSVVL